MPPMPSDLNKFVFVDRIRNLGCETPGDLGMILWKRGFGEWFVMP